MTTTPTADYLELRNFVTLLAQGKLDPDTAPLLAGLLLESQKRTPKVETAPEDEPMACATCGERAGSIYAKRCCAPDNIVPA